MGTTFGSYATAPMTRQRSVGKGVAIRGKALEERQAGLQLADPLLQDLVRGGHDRAGPPVPPVPLDVETLRVGKTSTGLHGPARDIDRGLGGADRRLHDDRPSSGVAGVGG